MEMKLSNMVAQLPENVAVDTFRARLGALIRNKGDGIVSSEYLEQIETCMRGYIDGDFEFNSEVSRHLGTAISQDAISADVDLPWLWRTSLGAKPQ
jgi:hypothetical protein